MTKSTNRRRFQPRLLLFEDRLAPTFGPEGPEFQVSDYQFDVRVASDADGDFVVAWTSYDQDGSGRGVYARLYTADGAPAGGEFLVNEYTSSHQANPSVAMNDAGDFVVAWTSNYQDGSGFGAYARRYSATGVALGSEFRVNTYTTVGQNRPKVAMKPAGDFVISWSSAGQDGSGHGIFAQRYNADGAAQGGEFQVNTYTTGIQIGAAVAMDDVGEFTIAWTSHDQDANGAGVYARRYAASGAALGGEFRVNSFSTGNQWDPKIAAAAAGDLVIVWKSEEQDGSGDGIYAQRYSSNGAALGDEFRVNTTTENYQHQPSVAMDPAGNFVVAWTSNGQDGSGRGVYAQRYIATGTPRGDEFQVNTYTGLDQDEPFVSADSDGDLVIVWKGYDNPPASHEGIYAQRYHANRPPTTSGIPNSTISTSGSANIDLSAGFVDEDDGIAGLSFAVIGNTNPSLFSSTSINGSTLTLTPAGISGATVLTVRATDVDSDFVEASFVVTAGNVVPTVAGIQVNSGATQRSRVTSLTATFNAQVTFAGPVANAFIVSRTGGSSVGFTASTRLVNGVTVVTLDNFTGPETQSGSLRDGRYTLTALAAQISAGGQQMASNYSFGDAQGLFRYYGDMNGDRRVDISDFGFFSLAYLTPANYNAALDFNSDGRIDIADFGQFSVRFFTTLP